MSKKIGGVIMIFAEEPRTCALCGVVAECRPYGPQGEDICFPCGQKDIETTTRMMGRVLFGEDSPQ